jgi:hypothetical protein
LVKAWDILASLKHGIAKLVFLFDAAEPPLARVAAQALSRSQLDHTPQCPKAHRRFNLVMIETSQAGGRKASSALLVASAA